MSIKEIDCVSVGRNEFEGQIFARDILISTLNGNYIISVCTEGYNELSNEENDEPCYVVSDIEDMKKICQELSTKSLEELAPFLTPQEE